MLEETNCLYEGRGRGIRSEPSVGRSAWKQSHGGS